VSLHISTGGRKISFRANGDVVVTADGDERVRGKWRASALAGEAGRNRFLYTVDGTEQPPLAATYAFTETNQLRVALSAADGRSEPTDLVGGIEIDDQHDIVYRLVDDTGARTGAVVTLYGDLRIEENTNALLIALTGGGEARIAGADGIFSLEAAQNRISSLAADDLLRFRASTFNLLENGGLLEVPAKLEFAGSWDVRNGRLVFLSKVTGALSRPDVAIGFAGRLGAVSAGFVYFADAAGTQAAFTIRGQHVWSGGAAQTGFNWQVSLGFSDRKLAAAVDFDVERVRQNGRRLSLAGSMKLKPADGNALNLDLSLEAEYEWVENALVFKALVNTEAGNFNYDLMLEGRFRLSAGSLAFSIRYTNVAGSDDLTIALSFTGDRENALRAIAVQLRLTPEQVELKIAVGLVVRQRFVAGVGRVLEQEEGAGT
jgi:hypothetical protein